MNDVDKLTLELFTNKNQYRKYLAKNEPDIFQEQENLYFQMRENQSKIFQHLEKRIRFPLPDTTQELMERLFYSILQEIDIETSRFYKEPFEEYGMVESHLEKDDEDDVLFPPDNMFDSREVSREHYHSKGNPLFPEYEPNIELEREKKEEKKSFWSKDRVVQRSPSSEETIISHYPTKSEFRKRYIRKPVKNGI
jgi:hypothetical protein